MYLQQHRKEIHKEIAVNVHLTASQHVVHKDV